MARSSRVKWFDQAIYSSPAVADLDGDGRLEILIGSGDAYKNGAGTQYLGHYVTALNFDGAQADPTQRLVTKWQATTNGPVRSSPAIGDVNLDGILDVVAISKYDNNGSFTVGSPGKPVDGSYIYAWNGATGAALRGFPVHACNSLGQAFPVNGSPILADIAGGNQPEILFQNAREVGIVNWDGSFYTRINDVLTCAPAPASQTSFVYGRLTDQNGAITATPVVADLDGDGDLEVAVVARYDEDNLANNIRGEVWVWTSHKNGGLPWPMFRQNPRHTAVYPGAAQAGLQPNPLTILYQFGGAGVGTGAIRLTNKGTSSFDWASNALAGITVTPDVGSLAEGQSQVLQVEISAVGLDRGVYPGGWVEVTAQTELSANPATQRADVTLIVADISKLYLPTILRR